VHLPRLRFESLLIESHHMPSTLLRPPAKPSPQARVAQVAPPTPPAPAKRSAPLLVSVAAALLSGALLGGATALQQVSSAYVVLAWVWLLPLLFALGPSSSKRRWFGCACLAGTVTTVTATYGLLPALGRLAYLYVPLGGLTLASPFLLFFVVRRRTGVTAALWTLPFAWVCTEWMFTHLQGLPPFLVLAYSQANATWLVQFTDLFGDAGLTAWLVLLNVALYHACARSKAAALRRLLAPLLLVILPLGYSAVRLQAPNGKPWYHVLVVQPAAENEDKPALLLTSLVQSTDAAVDRSKPDLILWPEMAAAYDLEHELTPREALADSVSVWGTPLVTGGLSTHSRSLGILQRGTAGSGANQYLNSTYVLLPGAPGSTAERTQVLPPHGKHRLVPFVEGLPYANVGWVRRLYRRWHWDKSMPFSPGQDYRVFRYTDDTNAILHFASLICWEEMYGEDVAEYVRRGAEFLVTGTRDPSLPIADIHASIARLHALAVRRPIVRANARGVSGAYDAEGRILARSTPLRPTSLEAIIAPSEGLSFYVQHPQVPASTAALALLAVVLIRPRRESRNNREKRRSI